MSATSNDPRILDADLLRTWPLPMPAPDADKGGRGQVLVIGGSREMPGAVILAATAALRAGAGKLTVATGASVAQLVASAIPESRVIGLPETAAGGIANGAADLFDHLIGKVNAVLIGSGMQDEPAVCTFAHALLKKFIDTPIVLDACAMSAVRGTQAYQENAENVGDTRLILTPHAGEMAHLLGDLKEEIVGNACSVARDAARNWNAVVALKGGTTFIASPGGDAWQHDGGNVGLATSGSGDVLAGIIVGLVARGATVQQATAWGVLLHAHAGENLAKRIGPIGYLAREIPDEIPGLLHKLARPVPIRKIVA